MKISRTGIAVVGGAVLLTLLGCAPGAPSPSASSSAPSSTPSSTPTPTPEAEAFPVALVMNATEMSLVDSDGATRSTVSFSGEDPADFAAALGGAFGSAAAESTVPGGAEGAEFTTTFTWDGVKITSGYSPGQCDGTDCRGTYIDVTISQRAGIALRTASGISVGDSVASAMQRGARPTAQLALAAEPENPSVLESTTETTRVVRLDLDADGSAISRILAGFWFFNHSNM